LSSSNEERRVRLHEYIDNIILGSLLPTLWYWDVTEAFFGNGVWLWSATNRKPSAEYINKEQCELLHYIIQKYITNCDNQWTPCELDRAYKLTNTIINLVKPRLQKHYLKEQRTKEDSQKEEEATVTNKKTKSKKTPTKKRKKRGTDASDSPPAKKKKRASSKTDKKTQKKKKSKTEDDNDENDEDSSKDNESEQPLRQSLSRLQPIPTEHTDDAAQVDLFEIPKLQELSAQNLGRISAYYLLSVLENFFQLQNQYNYVPKHEKETQSLLLMLHHIQTYVDTLKLAAQPEKSTETRLTHLKNKTGILFIIIHRNNSNSGMPIL